MERAWRFYNLDRGNRGGVDVHAEVATKREARSIGTQLRDLYVASAVEPVDVIVIRVVPDPERPEQAEEDLAAARGFSEGTSVSCVATRCADERATFGAAFAGDSLRDVVTLDRTSWASDDFAPETTVEVSAGSEILDSDSLSDVVDRVQDLAERVGLFDVGYVRTVVHYNRLLKYDFLFEV